MNIKRLNEIKNKSLNDQTNLSDIIEILYDLFISQSKKNKDIGELLEETVQKLSNIEAEIHIINERIFTNETSIYKLVYEEEDEKNTENQK